MANDIALPPRTPRPSTEPAALAAPADLLLSSRKRHSTKAAAGALACLLPAVAMAAVLSVASAAGRPAGAEVLNRVVLRVNDQIATLYEYQRRRTETMRQIAQGIQDPTERKNELDHAAENVFRDMFQELLLSSRADQLAIEVTDQQVDERLTKIRDSLGIKTDEEFQMALRSNDMTLDGLRAQTRRNLRIGEVIGREVTAKIKVKDEELRRVYREHQAQYTVPEQVQLREVVVLEDSGLPAAERAHVASAIRDAVAAGKSLADAAAPYAAKGQTSSVVEIGWVSPKDLDPKLEEAAWKLPKNGITGPVAARGGEHLLQLIDRHPQHLRPFGEVQASIQQQEQERIFHEESTKYMFDLEARSLVVADPPAEAANFRRRIGGSEDESLKSLADSASATGAADKPASAPSGSSPGDVTGTHPTTIDTTDKKQGGLPAAKPVGEPPKDTVIIPPPLVQPPTVASPAEPQTDQPPPASPPPPPPASPPYPA